ncbi:hypothetical protein AGMMS49960_22240 [Betaproteobacteria bacterium]|nr:hypothetical protein AGMMS49960_22240 [Betaproteobacteria bacterium]
MKEKLLSQQYLKLRMIVIILPNGVEEHIITNLKSNNFNYKEIEEIYSLRWGIETGYDTIKNLMQIENVSGYSELAIKQDYFSKLISYNIVTDIENTNTTNIWMKNEILKVSIIKKWLK